MDSSLILPINQLKFNLNSVVDNLNLVNVVHNPEPICIEKIPPNLKTNSYNRTPGYGRLNNDRAVRFKTEIEKKNSFEFIDEEKLSMYSFLVQRDLKLKEWMSNYDKKVEDDEIPTRDNQSSHVKNKKTSDEKNLSNVNVVVNNSENKKKEVVLNVAHETAQIISKSPTELNELKKLCDDSISCIEHLERQLNEFKFDRLKIVFNDPQEEEKQKRNQLEQIKYLSRTMYNLQNQLSGFKFQSGNNVDVAKAKKNSISPVGRLMHTMRQVNKTILTFADYYAYRPDNNFTAEKLCNHFYKQLHSSIQNFVECLVKVTVFDKSVKAEFNTELAKITAVRLSNLLANCDSFFVSSNEVDETEPSSAQTNLKSVSASRLDSSNTSKTKGVKVVRLSRAVSSASAVEFATNKNNTIKQRPKKNTQQKSSYEDLVQPSFVNTRVEISPSRKADELQFERKTIKTARLFPSKQKKPKQQQQSEKKPALHQNQLLDDYKSLFTNKVDRNEMKRPKPDIEVEVASQIAAETSPAFNHLSSPKVSIIKTRSRSRSSEGRDSERDLVIPCDHFNKSRDEFSPKDEARNSFAQIKSKYKKTEHAIDDYVHNDEDNYELRESRNKGKLLNINNNNNNNKSRELNKNGIKSSLVKTDKSKSRNSSVESFSDGGSLNRRVSFKYSHNIISRLDLIKQENENIKRKYEKLNYEQTLMQKFSDEAGNFRRPYEECYLEDVATVIKDYESKIDFDKVYRPLRHATVPQLNRVVEYAKKFAEYSQRTSITSVGESKFDDFELFEFLSDVIFDECFESVSDEVNRFNDELAVNLVNGEFRTVDNNTQNQSRNLTILQSDNEQSTSSILTENNETSLSSTRTSI